MFCRNCGARLPDGAAFCPGCGQKADIDMTVEAAVTPVQETAPPIQETTVPTQEAAPPVQEAASPIQEAAPPVQEAIPPIQETPGIGFDDFAREAPPACAAESVPGKKKGRGALIALISAAAVLICGALVGYFCFSNQIMRLFLGDAGFAVSLEKKTPAYLLGSSEGFMLIDRYADKALSGAFDGAAQTAAAADEASSGEDGKPDTSRIASALLPYIWEALDKAENTELRAGVSVKVDGLLGALLGPIGENAAGITGLLDQFEAVMRVSGGSGCDKIEIFPELGGKPVLGLELFTDREKLVLRAPDITDYSFVGELPAAEKPAAKAELSAAELKRLRGEFDRIYLDKVKEAGITYEDGEFTVANSTVKGTKATVLLTVEQLDGITGEISALLKNDSYLREYYTQVTGKDVSEYEKLFESKRSPEDSAKAEGKPAEIVTYIGAHAKVLAKEYRFDEGKNTFALARDDSGFGLLIETSGGGELAVNGSSGESAGSGTAEISFKKDEKTSPLVLELTYSGAKLSEFHGTPVSLGDYTLRVSGKDKFVSGALPEGSEEDGIIGDTESGGTGIGGIAGGLLREALSKLVITSKVTQSGDKSDLRVENGINIDGFIGISGHILLSSLDAETVTMPQTEGEKCLSLGGELSSEDRRRLTIDINKKLIAILEENKIVTDALSLLGIDAKGALERAIEEAEQEGEYTAHYSRYSGSSLYTAERLADELSDAYESRFMDWAYSASDEEIDEYPILADVPEEPIIVKAYFDADGKAAVIDDGGLGFIDFDALGEEADDCRSLYCEWTIDPENAAFLLTGTCVVFTDDPSDLPSGLPTTYNYIDGLYEWGGGEEGYKNGFVIGTSPRLYEGVSTAEQRIREEKEQARLLEEQFRTDLDTLNGYADAVSKAAMRYLPTVLSGPGDPSGFEEGSDEYYAYYEDHEFSWNTYSVLMSCHDGKWSAKGLLIGNYAEEDYSLITDGEIFEGGGKFEGYLDSQTRSMNITEDTDIELFVRDGEYSGVLVTYSDDMADFTDYYFPGEYDIAEGYFMGWAERNWEGGIEAGRFWLDSESFIPVGSWCACTGEPLSVFPADMLYDYDELPDMDFSDYEWEEYGSGDPQEEGSGGNM